MPIYFHNGYEVLKAFILIRMSNHLSLNLKLSDLDIFICIVFRFYDLCRIHLKIFLIFDSIYLFFLLKLNSLIFDPPKLKFIYLLSPNFSFSHEIMKTLYQNS